MIGQPYYRELRMSLHEMSSIEGFDRAIKDRTRKYTAFHKAHFCQFGYMKRGTLEKLGLWHNRPACEYIFLTKDEIRRLRECHMRQVQPVKHINAFSVLRIWLKLNPNGDITKIGREEYISLAQSIKRLHFIIREMRSRCHNPNSQGWKWYGAKGITICKEWDGKGARQRNSTDNFVVWSLQNGYRYNPNLKGRGDQLSIDRIDVSRGYSPSNCRWIPHRVNCSRAVHPQGSFHAKYNSSKNRRFLPMFPYAITNRKYVDWGIVLKREFNGDADKLRSFLKENGYSTQGICLVLRRLT